MSIPGKQMLVQVDNIHKTRWGRNWGSYERVDWVSDTDVETVSATYPMFIPSVSAENG